MNEDIKNIEKNKWMVIHFPKGIQQNKKINIAATSKNLFDKEQVNAIMECTEDINEHDMLQDSGSSNS